MSVVPAGNGRVFLVLTGAVRRRVRETGVALGALHRLRVEPDQANSPFLEIAQAAIDFFRAHPVADYDCVRRQITDLRGIRDFTSAPFVTDPSRIVVT